MKQKQTRQHSIHNIRPAHAGLFYELLSTNDLSFYLTILNNSHYNTLINKHLQDTHRCVRVNKTACILNKMHVLSATGPHITSFNQLTLYLVTPNLHDINTIDMFSDYNNLQVFLRA